MAKGDGSITQRGKGVWEVAVSFGKDPITGKYRRVTKTVHGTKRDAAKVRDQIRREQESGLTAEGAQTLFASFADDWHEARVSAGKHSKATLKRERSIVTTLNGYIGNVRLRDITPQMVEKLYQTIYDDKVEQRGRFSGTTLHMYHEKLRQILAKAERYNIIARNPCDRVDVPQRDDSDRRSLSVEEAARMLKCADSAEDEAYESFVDKEKRQDKWNAADNRTRVFGLSEVSYAIGVRIALATGMRRGEVFGLTWECVDLASCSVHVVQSLTAFGDTKKPKTKAGVRTIAIDGETVSRLARWKERQEKALGRLQIKQDGSTPVCCSGTGGFVELHAFVRWWQKFRADNGFEGVKFHELRHTQATQLLGNGVDVKTVQTRMGHSSASLTLDWYAHALPENDQKAARIIGVLFAEKPGEQGRIIKFKTA
ncbi:site-specific integrase [Slackia piriformis]|nr:site-specific integrase [Slackia piriformis]